MSHPTNTALLEGWQVEFSSSHSGGRRAEIIKKLRILGFLDEASFLRNEWYEERNEWLLDHGASTKDLLDDEEGTFFYEETENGNPGEDGYGFIKRKVYVPSYLDVSYWL